MTNFEKGRDEEVLESLKAFFSRVDVNGSLFLCGLGGVFEAQHGLNVHPSIELLKWYESKRKRNLGAAELTLGAVQEVRSNSLYDR